MSGRLWAIVLAGGEGSRLRALARDEHGAPAPKQFCPLGGLRPPLAGAIERAEALAPRERVLISVVDAHRTWWSAQLADRPAATIVSQPLARGTGVGILLPLLHVLERDPGAQVLILPADHAVEDEAVMGRALARATWVAARRPDAPVLVGVTPTSADGELGWVLPAGPPDADSQAVAAFIEKPGVERARLLMQSGALWNAFILASGARALMRLFERHLPETCAPFVAPRAERVSAIREIFASLPMRDFSHHLLTPAAGELRVLRAPACGWTDLGTPARLVAWLSSQRIPVGAGDTGAA